MKGYFYTIFDADGNDLFHSDKWFYEFSTRKEALESAKRFIREEKEGWLKGDEPSYIIIESEEGIRL